MPEVTITGMENVQRLMQRLKGAALSKALQTASRKLAEQARSTMMRYPGPPSHPIKWASNKQKRYYFAMRRKAGLPMEYTRTSDPMSQKLRHSWVVEKYGDTGAVVGTRVTYAAFVQSAALQQPMHAATGWGTDKEAIEDLEKKNLIERVVMAELKSAIQAIK